MRKLVPVLLISAVTLLIADEQKVFTAMQKRWWAIQPVTNPPVPKLAANEIDAFILEKLAAKKLSLSPKADRYTLIRRVTLDLTGIPPSAKDVQAFVEDTSPQAYETVVNRLLASPQYGERWARHWLDIARYADSDGFKEDATRPNIWRYRDYVIDSLNKDKPYDRFVREQIAGDELYPNSTEARIAGGFNRHFPDEYNQAHILLRNQELRNDITDTVGFAFLGVTMACARCHDHKFDPILHRDYYRLQAFFANSRIDDTRVLDSVEQQNEFKRKQEPYLEATKALRDQIEAILKPRRDAFYQERLFRYPENIQAVLTMPADKRSADDWRVYHKAVAQVTFTAAEIEAKVKGDDRAKLTELKAELAKFDTLKPAPLNVAQTMMDISTEAPKTYVLRAGAWDGQQEEVQPGFLSILDPGPAKVTPIEALNSTGRRTALANWLASPTNPLSTRVIVNRIWHYHFGRGIVGSPSDFGVMGERPTHKELLDWLTTQFVTTDKWSIKKLHKRILLSETYQQSSNDREDASVIDNDNKLLWKFPRRRLEAESVRDSLIAVSGMLNPKMGGPAFFPPLPQGSEPKGYNYWKKNEDPEQINRRSVYVFVRRNLRYPMFQAFDMPDTVESCARRQSTVTPDQSLTLMNDVLVSQWAKALAERVGNDKGLDQRAKAERAMRLVFGRPLKPAEIEAATAFLAKQSAIAGSEAGALEDLCHTLMSSNEFLYIN